MSLKTSGPARKELGRPGARICIQRILYGRAESRLERNWRGLARMPSCLKREAGCLIRGKLAAVAAGGQFPLDNSLYSRRASVLPAREGRGRVRGAMRHVRASPPRARLRPARSSLSADGPRLARSPSRLVCALPASCLPPLPVAPSHHTSILRACRLRHVRGTPVVCP